jgi:hypothetical protein
MHEDDRNRVRGLLDRHEIGRGGGQDDVGGQTDQLRCIGPCECCITGAPPNIDAGILAVDPSQLAQSLHECRHI